MGSIEDALTKLQERHEAPPAVHRLPLAGRGTSSLDRAAGELLAGAIQHEYRGRPVAAIAAKLRAQRMLPDPALERRLAEEYRAIKRPLLRNASEQRDPPLPRGNLLMVTSALAGEGKSFTCVNLSLSVAQEKDWSIVLVDADCNKPRLSQLFEATGERGLMDLLRDPGVTFDSLVMPTDVPGLSLLPAGRRDDQAAELLSSARMTALCEELASDSQRIVLFDAPPVLLTAEAPVLATQVGQIVLVVHANKTSQQAVLDARDCLDPSIPACLLLNQADARGSASTHGEYYQSGSTD